MISCYEGGNLVLRISDSVVVKCGPGVLPGDAATQKNAYRHLNCRIARVPQVYHYFQDQSDRSWPVGYLFMEYIPGKTLDDTSIGADNDLNRLISASPNWEDLLAMCPDRLVGPQFKGTCGETTARGRHLVASRT